MVIGTLERFGYELRVLSETKERAMKALMKEYRSAYKARNGCMPTRAETRDAEEEVYLDEVELDVVEWN